MTWRRNTGKCPPSAKGKRVHVRLNGGYTTVGNEPAGWAADERGACDWSLSQHSHAIAEYEVINE